MSSRKRPLCFKANSILDLSAMNSWPDPQSKLSKGTNIFLFLIQQCDDQRHRKGIPQSEFTLTILSIKVSALSDLLWNFNFTSRILQFSSLTVGCNRYILSILLSTLCSRSCMMRPSMRRADRFSWVSIQKNEAYKPWGVWSGKYLLITASSDHIHLTWYIMDYTWETLTNVLSR